MSTKQEKKKGGNSCGWMLQTEEAVLLFSREGARCAHVCLLRPAREPQRVLQEPPGSFHRSSKQQDINCGQRLQNDSTRILLAVTSTRSFTDAVGRMRRALDRRESACTEATLYPRVHELFLDQMSACRRLVWPLLLLMRLVSCDFSLTRVCLCATSLWIV